MAKRSRRSTTSTPRSDRNHRPSLQRRLPGNRGSREVPAPTVALVTLPNPGLLRIADIIGRPARPKARPPRPREPGLIPVSKSTWWAGVQSGRFPKPIKPYGGNLSFWRVEDIRVLIEGIAPTEDA